MSYSLPDGKKLLRAQKMRKGIVRVVLAQDEVNKGTRFSSRHLRMEVTDSNLVYKSLVPLSQGGLLDPGSPRSTVPPLE